MFKNKKPIFEIPTQQEVADFKQKQEDKKREESKDRVRSLSIELSETLRGGRDRLGLMYRSFISSYDLEPLQKAFAEKGWHVEYVKSVVYPCLKVTAIKESE